MSIKQNYRKDLSACLSSLGFGPYAETLVGVIKPSYHKQLLTELHKNSFLFQQSRDAGTRTRFLLNFLIPKNGLRSFCYAPQRRSSALLSTIHEEPSPQKEPSDWTTKKVTMVAVTLIAVAWGFLRLH